MKRKTIEMLTTPPEPEVLPLFDLGYVVAIVLTMIVLLTLVTRRKTISRRATPFILLGIQLLLAANLLDIADAADWLPGFLAVHIRGDTVVLQPMILVGACISLTVGLLISCGPISSHGNKEVKERPLNSTMTMRTTNLLLSPGLLHSILDTSLSGVVVLASVRGQGNRIIDFKCRLVNNTATHLLRESSHRLVGENLLRAMPWFGTEGLFQSVVSVVETNLPFSKDHYSAHYDQWFHLAAVRLEDGLALTITDIQRQKEAEEQLRQAAHTDTLTQLANRSLVVKILDKAIARSKRRSDYDFAVLMLDFDGFKAINDTLGHSAGDELLIAISNRLTDNLRAIDVPGRAGNSHRAARLGGDEFIVFLDGIDNSDDAVIVGGRLLKELSRQYDIADKEVTVTASIGIVVANDGYTDVDQVLQDVDAAMYAAKNTGKARCVVFDAQIHRAA